MFRPHAFSHGLLAVYMSMHFSYTHGYTHVYS